MVIKTRKKIGISFLKLIHMVGSEYDSDFVIRIVPNITIYVVISHVLL